VDIGVTGKRLEQCRFDIGSPHGRAFGGHGHDSSMTYALTGGGDKNGFVGEAHG
jgi:hypothetical protein